MVTTTQLGRSIEKDVFIRASPHAVFDGFTTPAGLMSWMRLAEAELDPRPGGYWRFKWRGGDVADGVIVEIDPPHRLVMDWHEAPHLHDTRLTVEIAAEADGARLRLVNSGFGHGGDWDTLYDGVASGWGSGIEQLRAWLEEGQTPA